jgi:hypothetical protein
MDLLTQISRLGGVTDRATLVGLRGTTEVDRALRSGRIVRIARGRYAAPTASRHRRAANVLTGVISHRSAAQLWGWAQKKPDALPEVTVPRNRRVDRALRTMLVPHWADLPDSDVVDGVTTRRRTLVDCLRNLPFDEALAIADSALREGDVTHAELVDIAASTRGRGRTRIMAVAAEATARAANPLESVLRAQVLLVPGLDAIPQHPVALDESLDAHPDVASPEHRLAFEAEGWEWHSTRSQLTRDSRRHNALALAGWLVIRFTWTHVMLRPAYVQEVLRPLARPAGHANVARVA